MVNVDQTVIDENQDKKEFTVKEVTEDANIIAEFLSMGSPKVNYSMTNI